MEPVKILQGTRHFLKTCYETLAYTISICNFQFFFQNKIMVNFLKIWSFSELCLKRVTLKYFFLIFNFKISRHCT